MVSANIFSLLAGITALFQLALVAGAPWGELTQGGRFDGALPASGRALALVSAVVLLVFIRIVRNRAAADEAQRALRYPRLIWLVVVYCALGIIANAATPSAAERVLWLPVVTLMFVTSLRVAIRRRAHWRDR